MQLGTVVSRLAARPGLSLPWPHPSLAAARPGLSLSWPQGLLLPLRGLWGAGSHRLSFSPWKGGAVSKVYGNTRVGISLLWCKQLKSRHSFRLHSTHPGPPLHSHCLIPTLSGSCSSSVWTGRAQHPQLSAPQGEVLLPVTSPSTAGGPVFSLLSRWPRAKSPPDPESWCDNLSVTPAAHPGTQWFAPRVALQDSHCKAALGSVLCAS